MDNQDIVKEWVKIAEEDLATAKFLKNMQPTPLEIICYHCQQSAEKFLKGFLALKEEEIAKTHDLITLNKICCKYDDKFKDISEDCLMLTDYSVNVRYPFRLEITPDDVNIAIEKAQKIKKFVLDRIK